MLPDQGPHYVVVRRLRRVHHSGVVLPQPGGRLDVRDDNRQGLLRRRHAPLLLLLRHLHHQAPHPAAEQEGDAAEEGDDAQRDEERPPAPRRARVAPLDGADDGPPVALHRVQQGGSGVPALRREGPGARGQHEVGGERRREHPAQELQHGVRLVPRPAHRALLAAQGGPQARPEHQHERWAARPAQCTALRLLRARGGCARGHRRVGGPRHGAQHGAPQQVPRPRQGGAHHRNHCEGPWPLHHRGHHRGVGRLPAHRLRQLDPHARQLTHLGGDGVVHVVRLREPGDGDGHVGRALEPRVGGHQPAVRPARHGPAEDRR
mmetsp:Transcript_25110/g.85968  ORF Transcript_25110/g.85968 Transcript_25110/m.85968 type:complete len:320 (-) Transcript_25110:390-1349(-)